MRLTGQAQEGQPSKYYYYWPTVSPTSILPPLHLICILSYNSGRKKETWSKKGGGEARASPEEKRVTIPKAQALRNAQSTKHKNCIAENVFPGDCEGQKKSFVWAGKKEGGERKKSHTSQMLQSDGDKPIYFYDAPSERVKEEHIFLNNFAPSRFVLDGLQYQTV